MHLPRSIRRLTRALIAGLGAFAALPAVASAHGPVAPVASSYIARVGHAPPGLEAKVVDGDLRMWLKAPPAMTVVVLDYRGAPYLRFSRRGVEVNQNSAMYYLNLTPVAATPPANLGPSTPPDWQPVTSGHAYSWHDGRLHALATVALAPNTKYVGRWSIALRVDGRPATLSGGVWHAADASLVWFWPIVVLLACVLAAWRVRDAVLDDRLGRGLATAALLATGVAATAHELHGRPTVSAWQIVELVAVLAFVAWGLRRMLFGRPGYFSYFAVAFMALWQGLTLVSTLVYGFVLIALPPFLVRTATVVCLATGAAILLLVYRLAAAPRTRLADPVPAAEPDADPLLDAIDAPSAALSPQQGALRARAPRAGR